MAVTITREFLEQIPKTDLHLHLDGSLRVPTLIELAKAAKVPLPSETEEGLNELVFKEKYQDLPDYLRGFGLTCAVLQTAENLERVAYELAQDSIAENVRYIEVRYAPQQHIHPGLTMDEVVESVNRGLARAQQEHNNSPAVKQGGDIPFHYGIITCAMRFFNRHMSAYYAQLFDVMPHAPAKEVMAVASLEMARSAAALNHEKGIPVVGFDIAGAEAGFPAIDHRDAYQYAHVHFIKKTVHAGEAYGPESIFQAITECHADRIGHGTFLFASDKVKDPTVKDPAYYVRCLVDYIASRRITLEVCPTSNLQTIPSISSVAEHPLKKMLETGLSVSICTDNRLVSRTSVTRELELVCSSLPVSPAKLRNLILAGFKGSFFHGPYNEKRALVRQVSQRYDALVQQHFGEAKD
ncbi:MAG TPA: adenosine deaminase family protein [Kiritimatiellia bacterium]|nr:adenosine deaminase family protein [Kiritimatiellia bacterium]HPR67789.1 adenosine deaminase family protein [Kiritimatiellia bacterium]